MMKYKAIREVVGKIKKYSIKNNRKRILKNYYTKEMKKGKTYRASILDKVFFVLLAYIILVFFLNTKSRFFILSLYMSGLMVFFGSKVFISLAKKREEVKIREINEGLKNRKIIREISSLNKSGFVEYTKSLLEDYYKTEINYSESFDLECIIEEERYGIKCIKIGMDEKVILRELENFNWELRREGMDDGILITNSYFRDNLIEEARVILYDFDNIVQILKDQGRYPSDKEIEDYIIDRFINQRNNIKNQVRDISLKKVLQIYGLFVIFYLLSYFVKYSLYYKIISIIIFAIITMISGYKIVDRLREGNLNPFVKK